MSLTDEQKRVKLAEANPKASPSELPDYLNDLNAIHEAEKTLSPKVRYDFTTEVTTEII